jgi:hypothetical protein
LLAGQAPDVGIYVVPIVDPASANQGDPLRRIELDSEITGVAKRRLQVEVVDGDGIGGTASASDDESDMRRHPVDRQPDIFAVVEFGVPGVLFADGFRLPKRLVVDLDEALAVRVGDEVFAPRTAEDVRVKVATTQQAVVAGAPGQDVVPGACDQDVIAGAAVDAVVARRTDKDVV